MSIHIMLCHMLQGIFGCVQTCLHCTKPFPPAFGPITTSPYLHSFPIMSCSNSCKSKQVGEPILGASMTLTSTKIWVDQRLSFGKLKTNACLISISAPPWIMPVCFKLIGLKPSYKWTRTKAPEEITSHPPEDRRSKRSMLTRTF